jgi:hypothetical protein
VHKVTDGLSYAYTSLGVNRIRDMAGSGVIRGGYHFLQANNGAAQADYFYHNVKEFLSGAFIAQLDFESQSSSPTMKDAWDFKHRWYALTGRRLFIYLPQWYASNRGFTGDLSGLGPLWASHYYSTGNLFTAATKVPASAWNGYLGWDSPTILQFSDAVSVANDSGLDGNIYRGSVAALASLADSGITPSDTPSGEGDEEMPMIISERLSDGMWPRNATVVALDAVNAGLWGGGPAWLSLHVDGGDQECTVRGYVWVEGRRVWVPIWEDANGKPNAVDTRKVTAAEPSLGTPLPTGARALSLSRLDNPGQEVGYSVAYGPR